LSEEEIYPAVREDDGEEQGDGAKAAWPRRRAREVT
jgi:hypothetical protein